MRGNLSDQEGRGLWQKDKSEWGVYRRGKMWYIRYRDQNGKPHAERVGPSKALALKVIEKRRTEVAERRFFPATGIPFEEIVNDAITLARESFKSKHPDKEFKPGNYEIIKKWFCGRSADSITPSEIAAKLAEHTDVPATFNRFRVAISHAYKIAVENKKIRENIGRLVKMRKEDNERVRYLNQLQPEKGREDEETRLRKAIRKLYPDKEAEIDLALHAGMRWAEQYELLWTNVDLVHSRIKLIRTKGGRTQHIPINAEAKRALARLRALHPKSAVVCPARDYWEHRVWWDAVISAAKVEDFRWHDLRHTFASRLVMSGVDIFTVTRLMRHKNIQVTMRYAHLADKHLASAVNKLVGSDTPSDTPHDAPATRPTYLQ